MIDTATTRDGDNLQPRTHRLAPHNFLHLAMLLQLGVEDGVPFVEIEFGGKRVWYSCIVIVKAVLWAFAVTRMRRDISRVGR